MGLDGYESGLLLFKSASDVVMALEREHHGHIWKDTHTDGKIFRE